MAQDLVPYVDAAFHLAAPGELPLDHGYGLYAGLSRALPTLHDHDVSGRWGVLPVKGINLHDSSHTLATLDSSRVTLRLPATDLHHIMPLAGQQIDVQGRMLALGIPHVRLLSPAPELCARYVTIKGGDTPEGFRESLLRQLKALFGAEHTGALDVRVGARRVMRVKSYTVVGFTVGIGALDDEQSLRLQAAGLGGKRKMGAGVFLPQPLATLMLDEQGGQE